MDALEQLAPTAAELLVRVDATLAGCGAPPGHRVWPLLRRVGALPGEAVAALAELPTGPLAAAAEPLRHLAGEYAQECMAVPGELAWRGAGAESFGRWWSLLSTHLAGSALPADGGRLAATAHLVGTAHLAGGGQAGGGAGTETMAGRLDLTAAYLTAIADWLGAARDLVARALAEALTSREAVVLAGGSPAGRGTGPVPTEVMVAAADLAAWVLLALADAYDRGEGLLTGWTGRLAELAAPVPAAGAPAWPEATIEVTP
ncbi:MAG TPA: hypothetical protein VFB84_01120 [Micromonosporaceae bacterium]|nr:hypothetical protein [Micromonosporaceae bacterium]